MAQAHFLRRMVHAPGFTAITLITLALGIGANTAIFSVVEGVLIKPLPYPDADRIVGVWHVAPRNPIHHREGQLCAHDVFHLPRECSDLRGVRPVVGWRCKHHEASPEPEQVRVLFMTDGALDALGVKPTLGRWLLEGRRAT